MVLSIGFIISVVMLHSKEKISRRGHKDRLLTIRTVIAKFTKRFSS